MKNREEIIEALSDFVIRVSKNELASPAELAALPEIANTLLAYCSPGSEVR